jgi:hypothetical protein
VRLLVDSLIAMTAIGVLVGVVVHQHARSDRLEQVKQVQQTMRLIESQALYRAAIREADASRSGYAVELRTDWFDAPPENVLVGPRNPWLETAGEDEQHRTDPACIVAAEGLPPFWYNPHLGIVRARVPLQLSQQATADLYNLVNGVVVDAGRATLPTTPPEEGESPATDESTRQAAAPTDPVLQDFQSPR